MLESLIGKKVEVVVFTASIGSFTPIQKGILTDVNDEAIMLDNTIYIARKYIITVKMISK